MSEFQPRDIELRAVLWFLVAVVLTTLCVGAIMLFNMFGQRRTATPTPIPIQELVIVTVPSPTPTLTPTPIPPTAVPFTATPASGGISCKYGPPFINPIATPVPDGKKSEFQDYLCVNGYWLIGVGDWVDARTGDWGTDGIEEQGYVMYNADGSIADRKFINLQGTLIPGPTK